MSGDILIKRAHAEWLSRLLERCEKGFVQTSMNANLSIHLRADAELQAAFCLMLSNEIKNRLLAND